MTDSTSILIVDDEKNMRLTLKAILLKEGYQVTTAATGEEAINLCGKNSYDAVLMDVRMPGLGGVDAFRRIRRHQEGVRVILMSAYSVEDLKRQALDEGAVAFLPKPLDLQLIIHLLKEAKDTAILVVDDDEQEATRTQEGLASQGYRVTVTPSPHDALELIEQIRFDIVLINAQLSSMTGLELYLGIKKITPASVAIMIAGANHEAERIAREAVSQTAYTMLPKPLNLDRLFELLQKLTGQQASGELRKPPLEPLESD